MSAHDESDEALMAAYIAGDRAAFGVLFERYAPRLTRLMQRQVRSVEDARDLVQQTFLQLHRARHDFRQDAELRPWLMTIALNLRREYFRKRGRRPEMSLELTTHEPSVEPASPLERQQTAERVRAALSKLPSKQREVIELHWFEEMKFSQVALVVGASHSAVKVRAHRGYERLRKILKKMNEEA